MTNSDLDIFPEPEGLKARLLDQQKWTRRTLTRPENFTRMIEAVRPVVFNTLSLPGWLRVAEMANVPYIPAREIMSFPAETCFGAMDENEAAGEAMDRHEREIIAALGEREMLRMEQVAPAEIKHQRSCGKPMGDGSFYSDHFGEKILNLYEERFFITLMDASEETVRAYARPIVTPEMIPGTFRDMSGEWPEEFRVFVKDGQVRGVSNYYPQVDMDPDAHGARMAKAVEQARRLIGFMNDHRITVNNAAFRTENDAGVSCTLDFLTTSSGEVLFLEGGPEGLRGAHPCCFLDEYGALKEDNGARPLEGAVFAESGPVHSMDDIDAHHENNAPRP